jgi:hypothetical protein
VTVSTTARMARTLPSDRRRVRPPGAWVASPHRWTSPSRSRLLDLAAEARQVGAAAADRRRIREDGWLVGHDPELALELAERGWLGMTWPAEPAAAGAGRSSGSWCSRRSSPRALPWPPATSPTARSAPPCCSTAPPSSAALASGHPGRHRHVVHRHERARRRIRRGLAAHPGRTGPDGSATGSSGRRCGPAAPTSPLVLPHRPHRPDAKPHAGLSELVVDMRLAGHRGSSHRRCHRRRPLLRGAVRPRAGAGRPPGGRPPTAASARSCARWSTSAAASTGWCRTTGSTATCCPCRPPTPASASRSRASRPATASAASSCCARCSARLPPSSPPPPRRPAPSTSSAWPRSAPQVLGAGGAGVGGARARRAALARRAAARRRGVRPRLHDHGWDHADPAHDPRRPRARPAPGLSPR